MKPRELELGKRNLIAVRVTEARKMRGMKQVELLAKLQLAGVDMSIPARFSPGRAETASVRH